MRRMSYGPDFCKHRLMPNPIALPTARYVAGEDGASVLNFLALWDDFLVFKSKAMAKDIETHFYPHTGFDSLEQSKLDEMNYSEHYHLHPPAEESDLPLKWHEAAPVIGKRVLTCHLTSSTESELKFIWSSHVTMGLTCCCVPACRRNFIINARARQKQNKSKKER